jgi:hypothetical protein
LGFISLVANLEVPSCQGWGWSEALLLSPLSSTHCPDLGPGGSLVGCDRAPATLRVYSRSDPAPGLTSGDPTLVALPPCARFLICKMQIRIHLSHGDKEDSVSASCHWCCAHLCPAPSPGQSFGTSFSFLDLITSSDVSTPGSSASICHKRKLRPREEW